MCLCRHISSLNPPADRASPRSMGRFKQGRVFARGLPPVARRFCDCALRYSSRTRRMRPRSAPEQRWLIRMLQLWRSSLEPNCRQLLRSSLLGGSSVGIASDCELYHRGVQAESGVIQTGPHALPVSYTMGTGGNAAGAWSWLLTCN
jgi:hypothetical protein